MNWTKDTEHLRKAYLIPKTLQHKVCMCAEPGPVSRDHLKMNHCATCRNPYRWYVRICTICRQSYIKDFRRSLYDCVRHNRCWPCHIIRTSVCDCEKEQTTREDFGPLGLNPRKFTREETRNIFSFTGPFD